MRASAIGETNERMHTLTTATDGYLIVDRRDGIMEFEQVFATREDAQKKIDALWLLFYSGDGGVSIRQIENLQVIKRNSE